MMHPERVSARLAATTRFSDLRFFETIESTNTFVAGLAGAGAREGLVVVADHQSAGRGRLDRRWDAEAGSALLVSILLDGSALYPDRLHLLTAAVALSARRACGEVGGLLPALKWPNDLLVGERKLAGILAEAGGAAVTVGMGLNVSAGPPGAACLGAGVDHDELLVATLQALDGWLGHWDELAVAYRDACATIGRRVRVELVDGAIEGDAVDVDSGGRLMVRDDDGRLVTLASGDVVHVRPAGGSW